MSYFAALNGGGSPSAAAFTSQQVYQQQQTVAAIKKELKGTPLENVNVFVPGGQFGNVSHNTAVKAAQNLSKDPAAMAAMVRDAQTQGLLVAPDGSIISAGLFGLNVSPWFLAGVAGISILGIFLISRKDG